MTSHISKVKKLYSDWSSDYDDSAKKGLHYSVEGDLLIKAANVSADDRILDIGCGTGRNIGKLLKHSKNVEGIDISEEMLVIARRKFPTVKFHLGNLEEVLPFPDNTFDKITCSLTFQFVQNIKNALTECYRILKPKGELFLTDFLADAPLDWNDVEYKQERKFKGSIKDVSTFRSGTEYKKLFSEVGFEVIEQLPLPVGDKEKELLTDQSFEKVSGKWATMLYHLKK